MGVMADAVDIVMASEMSDAHTGGSAGRWVANCCEKDRDDIAAAWAIEGLLVGLSARNYYKAPQQDRPSPE